MMSFQCLIASFYNRYKELIRFNRNIIVSAIITAISDIFVLTLASTSHPNNYLLVSLLSLFADFAIYNFIFIVLFFKGNRDRYIDKNGNRNTQKIKSDSLRLLTALGLSEIAYLSAKFVSTYAMFSYNKIEPSQISLITTVIAWILYLVTANIMIKKAKVFWIKPPFSNAISLYYNYLNRVYGIFCQNFDANTQLPPINNTPKTMNIFC